jgi:glutathione S-transferase
MSDLTTAGEIDLKLYYATGSCSMATHICLTEAGAKFELARLDRKNRVFSDGEPVDKINAKGYVPVLQLDNGQLLTENIAVLLYVADLYPATRLAPAPGTSMERYRLVEWLAFISTEIHKAFTPLFHRGATEELKNYALGNLTKRMAWLDHQIGSQPFVAGDHFTVADAYLLTVLSWSSAVKLELAGWTNLQRYFTDILQRSSVLTVMQAEGLIKK